VVLSRRSSLIVLTGVLKVIKDEDYNFEKLLRKNSRDVLTTGIYNFPLKAITVHLQLAI